MLTDNGVSAIAGTSPESVRLTVDGQSYLPKRAFDRFAKRAFDLVVTGLGVIVALPLFAVIAVLIKLDSKGPVFFRQSRVGRHRRNFKMWKFRKMYDDLPTQGPSLTLRYDFRMTRVGRILERTKLDELPQLLNVLQGHMSVIGPRPEVPKFVAHYPERWNDVLSVKPGIFGANQLRNRNESELYPPGIADVEGFYVSHILPDKLDIDADYARRAGLVEDVTLLARCLVVATFGSVTKRTLRSSRGQALNFLAFAAIGAVSMAAAYLLAARPASVTNALGLVLIAAFVKPALLIALRIPKSLAISMTTEDLLRLVQCALGSAAALVLGMYFFGHGPIHGLTLALDTAFFLSGLVLYKLLLYSLHVTFHVQSARALMRRTIVASVWLAPLTLAAVLALRHGIGSGSVWSPMVLLLPLIIRPMLVAFTLFPARRVSRLRDRLALQIPLLWTSITGSALMAIAAVALGTRTLTLADLVFDALLFHLALSVVMLSERGRPVADTEGDAGPERIVIAGAGVELAAYVSALVALPEDRFEVLGIVTPCDHSRTRTIGGHAILGELVELPEILKTLRVQRLVIVPHGVDRTSLSFLHKAAAEAGCAALTVPLLSGLLTQGPVNGTPARNGSTNGSHGGAHPATSSPSRF
jgi:lipopolysaccharide/colanic/teichoic acid biosynthesis glycosyltransferase